MRCTLVDRAEFQYVADLVPVPSPPGLYSLTIASRWQGAKDPGAEQVKLEVLVDGEGLGRLRELVDEILK